MAITRKTYFELDNGDKFETLEQALGNARLLMLQELFVHLFPEQKQLAGAWAKVFEAKNTEILVALQKIETDLAEAAKQFK